MKNILKRICRFQTFDNLMNIDSCPRKTHCFPSTCPKNRKNDSMWSGLRTNLLMISAKGVVYFFKCRVLGSFFKVNKALGLFIHERSLCLKVSSLVFSHVSLLFCFSNNGRMFSSNVLHFVLSAMQFTQAYSYSAVLA